VLLLLILLLLPVSGLPCSSDCYQCHERIPKDTEHEILATCTDCHPSHSEGSFDEKCGVDCFDCHPLADVIKSYPNHRVLEKCIECHSTLSPEPEKEKSYEKLIGG